MSDVKKLVTRYSRDFSGNMQVDPNGSWVLAADASIRAKRLTDKIYAAQSELAALREELAAMTTYRDNAAKKIFRMRAELTAAEQRNSELEADKARIDFWQENPKYAGGFAPSGEWSFFSREYGTCYGKDLRSAFDRLQVMHKDLAKHTESGASE